MPVISKAALKLLFLTDKELSEESFVDLIDTLLEWREGLAAGKILGVVDGAPAWIDAPSGGSMTAAEIRDALITLSGTDRLPASAVKDLPSGGAPTLTELTPVSGVVTIPLADAPGYYWVAASEALTMAVSGLAIGRNARCLIIGDASVTRSLTWPSSWGGVIGSINAQATVSIDLVAGSSDEIGLVVQAKKSQGLGYRYMRVVVNNTNIAGYRPHLSLVQFFVEGAWKAPGMTGASAPSPYVSSASNQAVGAAWKAFDGDLSTGSFWAAANGTATDAQWVGLDAGVVWEAPTAVRIAPVFGRSPGSVSLQVSATGAWAGEEVTLGSWTGLTGWTDSVAREFTV